MSSPDDDARLRLTSALDLWRVDLVDGGHIEIAAHAYSTTAGHLVFSALLEGEPCFEIDVAAIPIAIVADVNGGGTIAPRLPTTP